jgi:hypothetical protein
MKRNHPLFVISLLLSFAIGVYLNNEYPYVELFGFKLAGIDIFFPIVFLLLIIHYLTLKKKSGK